MVLLRALTTALDSTRFTITLYQTFSEIIFSPSADDVIGATFQQLSLLPQTWRLGVPLRRANTAEAALQRPEVQITLLLGSCQCCLSWEGIPLETWFEREHCRHKNLILIFKEVSQNWFLSTVALPSFKMFEASLELFSWEKKKWHQYKSTLKIEENIEWQSENKILLTWKIPFCSFISHLKEMEKPI